MLSDDLLIDNYDSFAHNLARYFERLGQPTHVVRNDAIDVAARSRQCGRRPSCCRPARARRARRVLARHRAGIARAKCRCSACASAIR